MVLTKNITIIIIIFFTMVIIVSIRAFPLIVIWSTLYCFLIRNVFLLPIKVDEFCVKPVLLKEMGHSPRTRPMALY